MKYLIQLVLLLIPIFQLRAQQTNTRNYVITRTYKQAGEDANNVGKVKTDIEYFDGLGRLLQQVSVGQGLGGRDIVQPFQYDDQGRQSKNFLPYTTNGSGAYQSSAISSQGTFYTTNDLSLGLDASDLGRPYSETQYERSPLNRPSILRAPGNKSANATIEYKVNGGSDVKRYDFNGTTVVENSSNYLAGTLSVIETKDEEQKATREYVDMGGKLICRKVEVSSNETLATYYVYDDKGLLRAVLQPKYQDNSSLADFAFTYNYDSRGRIITKSIPGAGSVNFVYDKYDRLALSQDANQLRDGNWGFTKYDVQNRPVMTGEIKSSNDRAAWQTILDASSAHYESPVTTGIGFTFPNATEPIGATEADVRTVTYYDNYSFRPANLAFRTPPSAFYSAANTSNVKSRITGGRTRMLPGDNSAGGWLIDVVYYDNEFRPIQTIRELFDLGAGSIESVSMEYKFDLAPVVSRLKTEHVIGGNVTYSHLVTSSYDHADRLLSVKEQVSVGSASKEAYTAAYRYNELGQLQSKWLHSEDDLKYRRRTDFTNNIRGWVTKGVTFYKENASSPVTPFYSFGLEYLNGGNYSNGNITAMSWSQKDEGSFSAGMGFLYDGANRLTGSTSLLSYKNLESDIKYDKNGNITGLQRAGSAVDNLEYDYTGSGNRLHSINDKSGNDSGVKKGTFTFDYDKNGNLTEDRQRGATITYNYLNLPKKVTIAGNNFIYDYDARGNKHKYTAPGIATFKYVGNAEYKTVAGANNLHRVGLSGGQAIVSGNTIKYSYYLKDHLGNVRVVLSEGGEILQNSDYYPFGLNISRDGNMTESVRNETNRYRYNGKEVQAGTGLVDYGARMYMPEIGRWGVIDGMAEENHNSSAYSYVTNNPMSFVDPFGLDTSRADANVPVNAGDVVLFDKIGPQTQSADEATVKGKGYQTLTNIAVTGKGIGRNQGEDYSYNVTKGTDKNFVDPFLYTIDLLYSLNLSGANNGDPNYKGGTGPGAGFFRRLLPLSKVVPNAGGKIVTFTTNKVETYYRVYSVNAKGGAFITKVMPKSRELAREGLALNDDWNTAMFIQEVVVPEGVILQRSRALPAFGKRGGLEQFQILNFDSRVIFGPGLPFN